MPEWLLQMVGTLGAVAAVYAGIHTDLARLHEKAEQASQSASRAHERIDGMLEHAGRR